MPTPSDRSTRFFTSRFFYWLFLWVCIWSHIVRTSFPSTTLSCRSTRYRHTRNWNNRSCAGRIHGFVHAYRRLVAPIGSYTLGCFYWLLWYGDRDLVTRAVNRRTGIHGSSRTTGYPRPSLSVLLALRCHFSPWFHSNGPG